MNRNQWKFKLQAPEVFARAEKKFEYHNSRVTFWEKKRDEIKAKIKSEGLEFEESVLADSGNTSYHSVSNFQYRQPTVNIRGDLLADLEECNSKVKEHQAKRKDYSNWVTILSQEKQTLELDHDDFLFFFGD